MKSLKIALTLLVAAIAGLGVSMAVTNPGPEEYEAYATKQLTRYLRQEGDSLCEQVEVPEFLTDLVGDQCPELLNSVLKNNQGELQALISRGTQRQNFGVLSIYRTNLEISTVLPRYEVETVGVFRRFYIYRAERL